MFRPVAAGDGRFVVLYQRLNEIPSRRKGRDMKILTGNSNKPLAEAISAKLALPLVKANIRRFSDNEIFVEILENVRGEDVFVVQSTSLPGQRPPDGAAGHLSTRCVAARPGASPR
jgi:hypothetical protein